MEKNRQEENKSDTWRQTEPEEVRRARDFLLRRLGGKGPSRTENTTSPAGPRSPQSDFAACENFINKLRKLIEKKRVHFRSQLSVYLGVNGFLFFLNVIGTGPFYPWFLFPAGAMGLGLLSGYNSLRNNCKVMKEVEKLPLLNDTAVDEFRNLKKAELRGSSMKVNFTGISAYLIMINAITSPGVPWALIPVGILGASYMGRRAASRVKLAELRDRFDHVLQHDLSSGSCRGTGVSTGTSGYELEARAAAEAIISRLKKLEDVHQLPPESEEILNTYLEQVKILSAQAREIDTILKEIPGSELAADRKQLEEKISAAKSPQLIKEYQRSLEEILDHDKAYTELEEQRELIELRIRSALNNLKKLRLDVARITSIAQISSFTNFSEIKKQSQELSDYIHDLSEGYREADEAMGMEKGEGK